LRKTLINQTSINEETNSKQVWAYLLPFGADSLIFQSVMQKYKGQDIQNCNFACILYACVTWSLILRDEHRLRVCDNRAIREISGSERDEERGEWRRIHNEKLYH
jgi:hypothetical protein